MLEALAVLVTVALASILGLALPYLSTEWLVEAGWIFTIAGMLLGLPTGFGYHVVLRSALRANGGVPPRWWLRPVAQHERLDGRQRPRVMLWFMLGGAGFAVTLLGCALVTAGVTLAGFRASAL